MDGSTPRDGPVVEDHAAAEVPTAVAKEASMARRGSKTRAAAVEPSAVMCAIASVTEQETKHAQQKEKEEALAGSKRQPTAKDQSGHTQDGAREAERRR